MKLLNSTGEEEVLGLIVGDEEGYYFIDSDNIFLKKSSCLSGEGSSSAPPLRRVKK